MTFELEETEYHLFFEDPKLEGLEVVMDRMALGATMEFDRVRFAAPDTLEGAHQQIGQLAEILGAHMVSWNYAKKGIPVSADAKGLLEVDERILYAVSRAYATAMREVPAPLALSSSDTGSSSKDGSDSPPTDNTGLQIPMEPLDAPHDPQGSS